MKKTKLSISAIAFISILAPVANAATVSTQAANPSTEANLIAWSQTSDATSDVGVGDSRDLRQSFTVTEDMQITSVFFRWNDNGSVTTNFSIDLNADGDFADTGELILNGVDLPAISGDWVKIDLSADNLTIDTGTSSLQWFSTGDRNANGGLYAERTSGGFDNYAGGDFTGFADTAFHDLDFAVTAIAVPEPSSAALLGLGGLALILRRRK